MIWHPEVWQVLWSEKVYLKFLSCQVSGVFLCQFCVVVIPRRFTLVQASHGPVDGLCAHQAEVVHADQMQQEVSAQALLHEHRAEVLHKQHAGMSHLIISYKSDKGEREERRTFDSWSNNQAFSEAVSPSVSQCST